MQQLEVCDATIMAAPVAWPQKLFQFVTLVTNQSIAWLTATLVLILIEQLKLSVILCVPFVSRVLY